MIIENNIEFHAAELREVPLGKLLLRMPLSLENELNNRARYVLRDSVGTEIRFVSSALRFRISLSAYQPEFLWEKLEITVFRGEYELRPYWLTEGVITSLVIDLPPAMEKFTQKALRSDPENQFSPDVWRIVSGTGGLIFCGLDTFGEAVRPPRPDEKPRRTCLCYGSSITNSHANGFPSVMARQLSMQLINCGFSGSCACEPAIADWITETASWDTAILELGTNLINWVPVDEFRRRADYFISRVTEKYQEKPVFLLTVLPSSLFIQYGSASAQPGESERFNAVIRELFQKYSSRNNLFLIEGADVCDDFRYLKADGCHPGHWGHAVIGIRLADAMKKCLNQKKI